MSDIKSGSGLTCLHCKRKFQFRTTFPASTLKRSFKKTIVRKKRISFLKWWENYIGKLSFRRHSSVFFAVVCICIFINLFNFIYGRSTLNSVKKLTNTCLLPTFFSFFQYFSSIFFIKKLNIFFSFFSPTLSLVSFTVVFLVLFCFFLKHNVSYFTFFTEFDTTISKLNY